MRAGGALSLLRCDRYAIAGWDGAHKAIIINVQRQPGANIIDVVDKIEALLPRLEAAMPQGIKVNILADRT